MTTFTPITVGNDRPISVTLSNNESKFADIDTMMTAISVCLAALDRRGPNGPVNPNGTSTGIPLVFKTFTDEQGATQKVRADIGSTAAFQRSLNGFTINAGESVIANTTNANAFGTNVSEGDALFALINNPTQDITNTTDWLVLKGNTGYAVSLSELQLLDTATETTVDTRDTDASTETTVTFYLLASAATVDGDLTGGQTGSFSKTSDDPTGIMYIRVPAAYITANGADHLYVETSTPNGTVTRFQRLDTYTERTDLLVGGDDVFESDNAVRDQEFGYERAQIVKLWRTRRAPQWNFGSSLNALPSIANGGITIEKLAPNIQNLLVAVQTDLIDNETSISSLERRVEQLSGLVPDVPILEAWADIYDPAQSTEEVSIVRGNTLIADFRGTAADEHYESSGVVYTDGTNVIQYTGLGNDFQRVWGFKVSGPSDQVLLWINESGTLIPFFDITAGGNLRVNNYTIARSSGDVVTDDTRRITAPTTGTGVLSVGGTTSTYTIPDFPTNSSNQSRSMTVTMSILINGEDSQAGGFVGFGPTQFTVPQTLAAQSKRTIDHTFRIGFPINRVVTLTFGYEFRVDSGDLLLDLTLENAPSDITTNIDVVTLVYGYTATAAISRVDDFRNVKISGQTDFTFSGEYEFAFALQPIANTNTMNVVPVALQTSTNTATQLSDALSVTKPASLNAIEIPDTIEFRTFLPNHFYRHIDLVDILRDRLTKWCYALARLNEVTEHAFTAAVDLFAGSKLDGTALFIPTKVVHHESVNQTTGAGGLITSTVLPTDYADSDAVYVEILDTGVFSAVTIVTRLLSQVLFTAGDEIFVDDKNKLSWTVGTRTLGTADSTQKISRVELWRWTA